MSDKDIEQEIQAKGANVAPRITPADIEANIASEHYFMAADATRGATMGQVAEVAHEVNRAYCQALGDSSQPALLMCALSSSARNEPVSAAARPPIRCGRPMAYAPRHGINFHSTNQSSFISRGSPSAQLR